jgi:FMN phosphatase YigB (HAD superfamily)
MFFQAAKEFNFRIDQCLYVGDDERDCLAAANAGCGMVYLSSDDKPPKLEQFPNPFFMCTTLQDAVDHIIVTYHDWESRV